MSKPRTLLGFDYGTRHIGIAVGQTVTGTATALASIDMAHAKPDWRSIERIVRTWLPDALVVGHPLNMDGTEQPMTRAALKFGHQLSARFGLPVHGADERLSSREARERRAARGELDFDDHAVAAQVILETWLGGHGARGR